MSYIFSESNIRQKLRRLEEINENNRTKLARFNKKKVSISRKEYERYKKILFDTDYKSLRESHQNQKNEFFDGQQNNGVHNASDNHSQKYTKQQGRNKQTSQGTGNNVSQLRNINGSSQQRNMYENQQYIQSEHQNEQFNSLDQRYTTPKLQGNQEYDNQDQIYQDEKLYNNPKMVTFNSGNKMNIQSHDQENILQQIHNYEQFDIEQRQLKQNINKIENEKQQLEYELQDLELKALNLQSQRKNQNKQSIIDDSFRNTDEHNLLQYKSNIHLKKNSIKQSSSKARTVSYNYDDSQNKVQSLKSSQKSMRQDFENKWDMLEKWENLNSQYPITPKISIQSSHVSPRFKMEDNQSFNEQNKSTYWEYITEDKKERQGQSFEQKIHSYLPKEAQQLNKTAKSYQEKQLIVDSHYNYGIDFLNRRTSLPTVCKYGINKYTIDRLSNDIEMLMRQTRRNNSHISSHKSSYIFI